LPPGIGDSSPAFEQEAGTAIEVACGLPFKWEVARFRYPARASINSRDALPDHGTAQMRCTETSSFASPTSGEHIER
jgi:hypothetical protein